MTGPRRPSSLRTEVVAVDGDFISSTVRGGNRRDPSNNRLGVLEPIGDGDGYPVPRNFQVISISDARRHFASNLRQLVHCAVVVHSQGPRASWIISPWKIVEGTSIRNVPSNLDLREDQGNTARELD